MQLSITMLYLAPCSQAVCPVPTISVLIPARLRASQSTQQVVRLPRAESVPNRASTRQSTSSILPEKKCKSPMGGGLRKAYLVSLMDDASRLITHSAFCPSETALDIEAVLKQAVLKRGLPVKLVIDNGPAYRAKTLQGICARLDIHLVYCRPYAPQGKGKLERWHRSFRDQFLSELDTSRLRDLADLNARLWAWLETVYHCTPHSGLDQQTPLQRYQQDLPRVRTLGAQAARLDELFYHRAERKVRKDGTVSYQGGRFAVPYELSGKRVMLVVDPHARKVLGVEDADGQSLGAATLLDAVANVNRQRRKPQPPEASHPSHTGRDNEVELAYRQYYDNPEEES